VAAQLRAQGREVSHLALLDWVERSMTGGADINVEIMALGALVRSLELLKNKKVPDVDLEQVATMNFDGKFDFTMELIYKNGLLPRSLKPDEFRASTLSFIKAITALLAHTPSPAVLEMCAAVPTLAFRAKQGGLHKLQPYDWEGALASGARVAVQEIDCDHWQLLKSDCAEKVGKAMGAFLHGEAVQSNVTAAKTAPKSASNKKKRSKKGKRKA